MLRPPFDTSEMTCVFEEGVGVGPEQRAGEREQSRPEAHPALWALTALSCVSLRRLY